MAAQTRRKPKSKTNLLTLLARAVIVLLCVVAVVILSLPLGAPVDSGMANSFLGTIAQVSASILAIVFSVSVLAVEIVSDRYSPRLFNYFVGNKATIITFFSYLICIAVSAISIGANYPMFQWGFLVMALLLIVCLLALPYYFKQTLSLLDPKRLASRIQQEASSSLKKRDWGKMLNAITSLGDITLKALKRDEEDVTRECLTLLHEVHIELYDPGSYSTELDNQKVIVLPPQFRSIQPPVTAQYYRIFKAAADAKSVQISQSVAHWVSEAIYIIVKGDNADYIRKVLYQFDEFVKISLEADDISRLILLQTLHDIVLPSYGSGISEENISMAMASFMQLNKRIIEQGDLELWKEELDFFSRSPSIEDAYDSLSRIFRELLKNLADVGIPISNKKWLFWHGVLTVVSTRVTSTNRDLILQILFEIERLIPPSAEKVMQLIRDSREALQKLDRVTHVYDVFYYLCVYALFCKKHHFIKELWQHTNPPDADAHWGNPNMVHLNIGFLTHQVIIFTMIPFEIDQYHGAGTYALEYYLLCLAYAFYKHADDWHPSGYPFLIADLQSDNDYAKAIVQDLRSLHSFLINLPYWADKALARADNIKSIREEWDNIFNGNLIASLEKACGWLSSQEHRQEWIGEADSIVTAVPLNSVHIEAYQKFAFDYYRSNRLVVDIAILDTSEAKVPVDLIGSCHFQCPEKIEFTKIGLTDSSEIGKRFGYEAIDDLIKKEVDLIIQRLQKQRGIKRRRIDKLSYTHIQKAAQRITVADFDADVLMVNGLQLGVACESDDLFRRNMEYFENDRYLRISPTTKLKIIEIKGNIAFVLSKKAGKWITTRPLDLTIQECVKKTLKVKTVAGETVDYQIEFPRAVQILEIKFDVEKAIENDAIVPQNSST